MSNYFRRSSINRREILKLAAAGAASSMAAPYIANAQASVIRIGHQQDMTGFLSFYGFAFDKGARGAIERINAQGGIAGRKLEYILEDTESDVANGIRKFRKLVESDKSDFVLGATHSGTNLATNPIAKELKTIVFPQGEASATTDSKGNRYVFRIRAHSAIQGRAAVTYAVQNLGKKWTFIVTDYAYGHSFYDELAPMVKAAGGTVVEKIAVPVQSQDMMPFLARVSRDTDVVFSVFTSSDGVRFLRQGHEIGLSKRVARLGPWGMIDGMSMKGIEAAVENAYFLSHGPRWLDQVPTESRGFIAEARKIMGIGDDGAVLGVSDRIMATSYYLAPWHAIHLLKHAIEKSNWESKQDNPKLIQAMEGFSGKVSLDFPMSDFVTRGEDHQSFQTLWIEQAKSGKLNVVASVNKDQLLYPPKIDVRKESF
ncbi:ABC transporter substrate-binding protein [Afipia sp. Root123D2]|uniref:ABC transporter substrate-binding protein n=1 Tax=Afipia sp. Root123D2 TaxID=1736436 RepID=UPI0009EBDA70|nr:ABC transporter substrate-binding protein [Afipia sp. Root123D2]